VVVGVEEGQGLLLEDEEDGVDQLEVLGEVVKLENCCQFCCSGSNATCLKLT
jgi:hypothetical protein